MQLNNNDPIDIGDYLVWINMDGGLTIIGKDPSIDIQIPKEVLIELGLLKDHG